MDINSETSKRCAMCFLIGFFVGVAFMVFVEEAQASERDDMVTRTEVLADQLVQPTVRELTAQIVQHTRLADDDMYQTGSWAGIQISYGNDTSYLFGSYEETTPIPLWGIGKMNLTGFGAGSKWRVNDRLTFWGQIGYYFVDQAHEGRGDMNYSSNPGEGLLYYFNKRYTGNALAGNHFDEYMINYDNTIAGTVGLDFTQPLTENLDVGFTVAYRSMRIREMLRVMKDEWNYDTTGACWEQQINRNYSTISYGLSLNYQF